jgi:hypothetical protein
MKNDKKKKEFGKGYLLLKTLILLTISIFLISNVYSQEDSASGDPSKGHSIENHHRLNELAVFVGGTAKTEIKGTYFSLGLDYARLLSLSGKWRAGAFAEVLFTKHPEWVFGAFVYYHFYDQFFVRTGPGIEIIKHEEIDPECNCTHVKSETEILYRVGLGYSHHTKNFILIPTIDIDLVRSETAMVFGLNIGFAF